MITEELKDFNIKWAIIIILYFMVIFLSQIGYAFYHEAVHGAIYDQYGVNYTKGFMLDESNYYMPAFYVKTVDSSYQMCNEVCASLQTENEIISYNIMSLGIIMFCILFVYLVKEMMTEASQIKRRAQDELNSIYPG